MTQLSTREIVLCQPVRTAIGGFNGAFKGIPATELGAAAVRETLARAKLDPARLGSVVLGNVIQAGNKMNPARQAELGGGVPVQVPALTVNRVCGSGAQAVASAAQEVMLGLADVALAGGMERTWTARLICSMAAAGAIAWATPRFTTACCVTVSSMPFRASIRAGIPKTSWKNIR